MSVNNPDLWRNKLPRKTTEGHKYASGHALIYGAPELTGATRLAAAACARVGTGLVSVLATTETVNIYRAALPACILVRDDLDWQDARVTARIYGPGGLPCPVDFDVEIPTVLDADALKNLPEKLSPHYVLTPHEGEFAKAFPMLQGDRIQKTLEAAKAVNATLLLKGAETIIAEPNGCYVINDHATPDLATAGSGDVLSGIIGGLLAQGMPAFDAACAGTWIHGECARQFGRGLIADDLPEIIPSVLKTL